MNFCAVVVWYNPDYQSVNNILKYNSLCSKVFIVDNSFNDNSILAKKIQNAVYYPNFSNVGIGEALNFGCEQGLINNFEWCMTMDQDSSWDENVLNEYLKLIEINSNEINVSFAPVHSNKIKSLIGDIKNKKSQNIHDTINFPDKVMTSGNFIKLSVWEKIGKFNSELFIDEIDHEFSYRLITNGYKICEFQNILMIHTLGNVKKTILPRPCKHSGARLYYIFRNILYIKHHYRSFYKRNGYTKYLIFAYIQKVLELKFTDLSYMHKGIKAYKQNKFGKINE